MFDELQNTEAGPGSILLDSKHDIQPFLLGKCRDEMRSFDVMISFLIISATHIHRMCHINVKAKVRFGCVNDS